MEEEFIDIDTRNAWNAIYQEIRNKSNNYNYTYKDANKIENKNLNRYRDVNPFDHSRVRLQRGEKDYINASFVEVPTSRRSYILTQGPLPVTAGHFWLMVWEQKTKAILMLNRIIEKNAVKCHQYWPSGNVNGGEDNIMFKDVGLLVSFITAEEKCNYTIRKFFLTDFESGKSKEVLQFHYTTWPDFGVPESPAAFLNFLFAVRKSGALNENVGPPVVHCSAGIGRSGTFCLVDSCLVLIEQKGSSKSVNICELLLHMRQYRMGLIQTADQLRFSYMAIIEGSCMLLNTSNCKRLSSTLKIEQVNLLNECKDKSHKECELLTSKNAANNVSELNIYQKECTFPPPLPPRSLQNHEYLLKSTSMIGEEMLLSRSESFCCNSNSRLAINNENDTVIISSDDVATSSYVSASEDGCFRNGKMSTDTSLNQKEDKSIYEVRRRKRKERSEKTAEIVQKIKKKQRESETWQTRKSLLKRLSLGIMILVGTGMFVYRLYSKV